MIDTQALNLRGESLTKIHQEELVTSIAPCLMQLQGIRIAKKCTIWTTTIFSTVWKHSSFRIPNAHQTGQIQLLPRHQLITSNIKDKIHQVVEIALIQVFEYGHCFSLK